MESFAFWLDRSFDPRRGPARPTRRRSRVVTIRYQGSFGRSAVKALIVLAFLAAIASFIGERPNPDLGANDLPYTVGQVGTTR